MKFKVFGTEVYISFLFAAVIAFMLVTDRTGLIIPTLFAVFIHETGHLFAMWVLECQPKSIRLIPASVQIIRSFSTKPMGEVKIALIGPLSNAVVATTLFLNYLFFNNTYVLIFATLNLVICLFNLLPVSGLDGGIVLEALIAKRTDPNRAAGIVRILTAALSFIMFVAGVYLWVTKSFNISVFIVALYLLMCSLLRI